MNTKVENLRALCFNCIYELTDEERRYRHRETPIGRLDDKTPGFDEQEVQKTDELSYIPFEEFQKILNK